MKLCFIDGIFECLYYLRYKKEVRVRMILINSFIINKFFEFRWVIGNGFGSVYIVESIEVYFF